MIVDVRQHLKDVNYELNIKKMTRRQLNKSLHMCVYVHVKSGPLRLKETIKQLRNAG